MAGFDKTLIFRFATSSTSQQAFTLMTEARMEALVGNSGQFGIHVDAIVMGALDLSASQTAVGKHQRETVLRYDVGFTGVTDLEKEATEKAVIGTSQGSIDFDISFNSIRLLVTPATAGARIWVARVHMTSTDEGTGV